MNQATPGGPQDDTHAFVLRMRREPAPFPDRGEPPTEPEARLRIRVEHVNTRDTSLHDTMDGALAWLRRRMSAVLSASLFPDDPAGRP